MKTMSQTLRNFLFQLQIYEVWKVPKRYRRIEGFQGGSPKYIRDQEYLMKSQK